MRKAEPLAGLGGIALFVSLFLTWYVADPDPPPAGNLAAPMLAAEAPAATAWRLFSVIDILLALLALLAIAVPLATLLTRGPAKSIGTAVLASAFGWIAIALVLFRVVFPPFDEIAPSTGAYVALGAAIVAWVGSWLSLRDESTPGAAPPDLPRLPAP